MGRFGRGLIGGGITVVLLFGGGLTSIIGFFVLLDANSKLDATARTTGSVVELYRGQDSDGFPLCSAAIEYQAGAQEESKVIDVDCDERLIHGDSLALAYDPGDPTSVYRAQDVEDAPEQRGVGRGMGLTGIGVLVVALVAMFGTVFWVGRAPDPSRRAPAGV